MSTSQSRKELKITDVFTQLRDDGIESFMDSELTPTVKIPDDGFQKEWPVDSERVQDLLVSIWYELSGGAILKSTELGFLLSLLREECRKGGRRLTETETTAIDKDPIVQAILALMNLQAEYSSPTVVLLHRLQQLQKEGATGWFEGIPAFTNIFVRRLNRLITALRGYGVEVAVEHRETGSHCSIKRLASFQKEPKYEEALADGSTNHPSGQPSGVSLKPGRDLPSTDDSDGEFRGDPSKATNGTGDSTILGTTKKGGAK